ncbi:MAG: hypothetical protein ACJ73S_09900 [Mycobacteriales bacterium]
MSEEFVLTPGGLRPREQVNHLQPGASVDGADSRLTIVHQSGEIEVGLLERRVEGQPLMPANVVQPKAVEPALGTGWITYSSWLNDTGKTVSSFVTKWVVPAPPTTHNGQTIFLFNGIQNSTMIYQPVLQWGPSAAGGGNFWSVASWYVDGQGGPAFHTNLITVNPGDVLTGVMTLTGSSASGFNYNCQFQGIANSSLPISNVEELTWLIETLEVYGVTVVSDYPDTAETKMSSIGVALSGNNTPSMTWTANNAVTDTGQHTVIMSNSAVSGEVDLHYYGDQANWAWCNKCQSLAFAGNPLPGACAAGGSHNHAGSGNYVLMTNRGSGPGGQSNWRWCNKCQVLAFAGNASLGPCPAGGNHNHSGSGDYVLPVNGPAGGDQNNWRWCNKCQVLAFAGNASQGACQAGGSHDHTGSGNYALTFNQTPIPEQSDWRWCNKCQAMAFAGNASQGACPAGGKHDHGGSGDYSLAVGIGASSNSQSNWRWCNKCQVLSFAGNASQGPCSGGGNHSHSGSGDYTLSSNTGATAGAQSNWRWCNKCQELTFAGNASLGACQAGGSHNHTGSGDYLLAFV